MRKAKQAIYRIDWQILRVGLSFGSLEATEASCRTLTNYLARPLTDEDTRENRLWRVINLCNATCMGLNGIKAVGEERLKALQVAERLETIRALRDPLQEEYHSIKKKNFQWDEELEILRLHDTPASELIKVRESLLGRKAFAKSYWKAEVAASRPELCAYLLMLDDAISMAR